MTDTDILRGAGEIAALLYGDRRLRRRVYHLAATRRLPVFRLGQIICARRSVLLEWIARQERAAMAGTGDPAAAAVEASEASAESGADTSPLSSREDA